MASARSEYGACASHKSSMASHQHSSVPAPPAARCSVRPPRRRSLPPPCAFLDTNLLPGWVMPSWLGAEAADPQQTVRQQRLQTTRRLLSAARREPPLMLPPLPEDAAGGSNNSEDGGSALDFAHSASNAVPFVPGSNSGPPTCTNLSPAAAAAGPACRAEEARPVLPWLYAVEGRLDLAAMETLAAQLALSGLQLLDVSRYLSAATAAPGGHWHSSWGGHVRWAGPQALPSPAVAAAAALRRMELRRGGALQPMPDMEGKAVVLAYPPQHRQLAAEALALYLHAYLGISGQEAVEAAGNAVGTSPLSSTLRQHLEEVAVIADGWFRRVTLAWPYAGGHVEIVGDAVGGWDQRAPMVFDVKRKRWQLQIWGLQPGIHRFKYLVDGCWVIDLAAHTEADSRGNINNVVMVTSSGKPLLRVRRRGSTDDSADGGDLLLSGDGVFLASSSDEEEEDEEQHAALEADGGSGRVVTAAAAAAASGGVLATAEPPQAVALAEGQEGEQGAQPKPLPKPWGSEEELVALGRFGAAVLAFHTRLGVQLRHVMH